MDVQRLKSLRAANKAAVTKFLKKLEDITKEELVDSENVKNILNNIQKKKVTLEGLDGQILEKTEEEDMADEIMESDEYYLELDDKLRKYKKYLDTNANPACTSNSTLRGNAPEFNPFTNQTQTQREATQTFSQMSTMSSQNHRLPKLSLPNFSGEILDWQYFWDSYESTVHFNHTLTDVQKFSYLKSLLQYDAANVISGLTMTNANYHTAIELLRNRYGQPHKITNAYMKSLLDLPAPLDNIDSLRTFHDKSEAYIRGLESLGQSQEMFGSLLIPVILSKLPPEFRKTITRENGHDNWNIQTLRCAITQEISIQESGYTDYAQKYNGATPSANFVTGVRRQNERKKFTKKSFEKTPTLTKKRCVYCNGNHWTNECKEVTDYEERISIVKERSLCFNCLGTHRVADCNSRNTCKFCHRKHHSTLCKKKVSTSHKSQDKTQSKEQESATSVMYTANSEDRSAVLLKTAISPVVYENTFIDANILFDEGAQRSFITQDLATKLNVKKEDSESLSISTFGNADKKTRNLDKTTIYLKSNEGDLIPIKVLIVPTIAPALQNQDIPSSQRFPYLRGLQLAHPVMHGEQFEINLLIGGDFYWDIVQDKIIRGNGPTAVSSKIGYLLSGPVPTKSNNMSTSMMNILVCRKQEETDLEKFWKLESLGINAKEQNDPKMNEIIADYMENSIIKQNEKYVAKLPWKEDSPELPTNRETAKRRTESVIRRLVKEPEIFRKYGENIAEQERRGFIERIPIDNEQPTHTIHYIPHHPVRKDSTTTPIRIVYNCSCKANKDSPCLNDCLESYPPLLPDLTEILVRFRMYNYAVTADIEKAFLQIELDPTDRDATRFFWLEDPTEPQSKLITYRFRVVLFGATCSPFMLSATLMKHFRNNPSSTSSELQNNLYVDNVLTSFIDENSALNFYAESRKLLSEAGFNLRSWNSNSKDLQNLAAKDKVAEKEKTVKILGMKWNTETDKIEYQPVNITEINKLVTKRQVLSSSSRIFDPLGLIAPVTVKAKLFMQQLWKSKLDWDEILSEDLSRQWHDIAVEIENATNMTFQRSLLDTDKLDGSLHIFTDASQLAYGACAYLVTKNSSLIIMAKNRVAPVKTISLPRLELMGAVTGARLANHLREIVKPQNIFMWSDSQIVLSWIISTKKLKPFIANRLSEIRELIGNCHWDYCPTEDNPADYLTRGISAKQLQESTIWINGPNWILERENWPTWNKTVNECNALTTISEEEIVINRTPEISEKPNQTQPIINISRYSSLQKLVRVTGYILRFIGNIREPKEKRQYGSLSLKERNTALRVIVKLVQKETFHDEISSLESTIKGTTLIRQLKLYIDENELLRCAGRIHNAPVNEDTKHPMLLPTHHSFTALVINEAHEKTHHGGPNITIANIQQKYWIPRIRQTVRSQLRKCVTCRKIFGKPYSAPDPPPLPKHRVNYEFPFSVTGVDFTGALETKGPNNEHTKSYICLFTCAATRAVHLEIVPDLSEESFILTFRRFCARRSVPRIMISDNGSNFKASAERITRSNRDNKIQGLLNEKGTEWKFIPNRAPWFGGYWERLIGITKRAIKCTLGKTCVSTEMLRTIVTEIEATMNNRPITYISTDITDPEPLTPAHMLYGRRTDCAPDEIALENSVLTENLHSKLNRNLQRQNELLQQFRKRWTHEYLTSLLEYHRTTGKNEQLIKAGDVVLVHNDSNRITWKLAVVKELVRGKDGLIRSAVIKTENGITNRPIVKLFPLEVRGAIDE